jgi:ABC-type Fe3+ transport system permease subunit
MSEVIASRRQFTLTTMFWFATVVGAFLAMVFAGDGPGRVAWGWALFLCLFIPSAVSERR